MPKTIKKITYMTLELDCKVKHVIYPGDRGDRFTPPTDATAEIHKIEFHGMDITKHVENIIGELENELLED